MADVPVLAGSCCSEYCLTSFGITNVALSTVVKSASIYSSCGPAGWGHRTLGHQDGWTRTSVPRLRTAAVLTVEVAVVMANNGRCQNAAGWADARCPCDARRCCGLFGA